MLEQKGLKLVFLSLIIFSYAWDEVPYVVLSMEQALMLTGASKEICYGRESEETGIKHD